ncbi:LysR family transcriptional regulator [Shimia sp. R10_1]|uniref:LysR family transcriptional regulator n=1 Tax=Shimia sp. R10_1 TaxID=2821095 RepID=UPI001ADB6F32|nr:LysR family transcriptional regulator [Shimia sp. R10_1]MBO9475812.1 LysR family transcriptional regulator [Shimia sp. R10_1]
MSKRPYNLPRLSSLVSFEAAARKTSFKLAATELNVTPAAVSHQIKALEKELQCNLFHRFHRGVELTESGAYLLVALQRGFEGINDAFEQLRAQPGRNSVTIRSSTAVSSLWLTPRLAHFWKSYEHISVAQIVNDTGKAADNCDLSLHYGEMSRDNGHCRMLFRDRIMALCSPQFATQHAVDSVDGIAEVPLIHLDSLETGGTDWQVWAHTLGYSGPLKSTHRVNNYIIALQAAQDDMGAVLGWEGLTAGLIASGKLVKLLPETITAPLEFYVKLHNQSSDRARLVFDWLAGNRHQRP